MNHDEQVFVERPDEPFPQTTNAPDDFADHTLQRRLERAEQKRGVHVEREQRLARDALFQSFDVNRDVGELRHARPFLEAASWYGLVAAWNEARPRPSGFDR